METWLRVNGMRIHCLQSGGAPGGAPAGTEETLPPLVLVHGWAGAAADWAALLEALPAGRRAVAVDLPGSGKSDKPDAPYDLPWMLDFLSAFCNAAGAPTIALAGHSLGGMIAVHFAARNPSRVQKLILVDPYGLRGERGKGERLAHLGPLVRLAFSLNSRTFITLAMRGNVLYRADDEVVRAAVDSTAASILGSEGARALARVTNRVVGRGHVDELLPGLAQPALVLWGENDRMLSPRWAAAFGALLPRARVETIPGAGHMPMLEQPRETAARIARFLEE